MRFHNPLTHILDNKTKVLCLRILCKHPTQISGRQLAKIVNINPTTVNKAMKSLAQEDVVFFRAVGKSYLYEINNKSWVVSKVLIPAFKLEGCLLDTFIKEISKSIKASPIKNCIISVALFGSVHEHAEGPGSDIDLFFVVKKAKDKKKVADLFMNTPLGGAIEPYIKTVAEFRKNRNLNVITSILNSHRIIWGERLGRIL